MVKCHTIVLRRLCVLKAMQDLAMVIQEILLDAAVEQYCPRDLLIKVRHDQVRLPHHGVDVRFIVEQCALFRLHVGRRLRLGLHWQFPVAELAQSIRHVGELIRPLHLISRLVHCSHIVGILHVLCLRPAHAEWSKSRRFFRGHVQPTLLLCQVDVAIN